MKYEPWYWLNTDSEKFLNKGYLPEGATARERYRQIAEHAETLLGIVGYADKFEDYLSRGFYSLSSPVIANYGTDRGLPVSCFSSFVSDSVVDILEKQAEVGMMTKMGGGTSAYFGDIRPRGTPISVGGVADGPVNFMQLFDSVTKIISQGSTRRGAFAAYLPIEHPDIEEFLLIRKEGNPIQEMNFAITITDQWMEEMLAGDKAKRKLWGKVIQKRFETGYPYIMFVDTVNRTSPQAYRDQGRKIHGSNLCSEVLLSTNRNESFVCVLSSLNVLHWDEIVETDAIETMMYFLDTVTTEFINKAKNIPFMDAAVRFAENHRAVGLGVLGWHSLLQSRSIPIESMEAKMLNASIFKTLDDRSLSASQALAKQFGEPSVLTGYGERMTTRMAIAPTTSSSFILGQVSQGIEPFHANTVIKDLAKGVFPWKNPFLREVLKSYGQDTKEVWQSINEHGGSVQFLDFLSDHEKEVFKTFGEISQLELIIQAAQRQKWIDQSQSLNVMIPPDTKAKVVSELLIEAWKLGVKTLYYQRSANPAQELARNIMHCVSCEA